MTRPKSGPAPTPVPHRWVPLIDGYTAELRAAGRPQSTITTRLNHVRRMSRELSHDPNSVTSDSLKRWFASQSQWRIETRRGYRNSAAQFFAWAHKEGYLTSNPATELPTIKPDKPSPRPAPDRVWDKALTDAGPRVALMMRLAGEVGLRRAEVAVVHTRDLREGFDGPQLLIHGKGNRERVVPITYELADLIAQGAPGHSPEMAAYGEEGYLFPGDDNGHLSPRWVGKMVAEAMPAGWTMHTLRHRFATRAYRGTRNLRAVQTLLGHANVAVTERYTAVDDAETRAAMEAAADCARRRPQGVPGVIAAVVACVGFMCPVLVGMLASTSPLADPPVVCVDGPVEQHIDVVLANLTAIVTPCTETPA
ncbi:tyrosine-type recombinase/integrase [Mycolicibacterium fortuitum]|nr:tyrosine-type recombinase/integrase [Mycolicibacterium fortuitum]